MSCLLTFYLFVFQELIRIIRHAEILIARNLSLKSKFTQDLLEHADAQQELEHFISSILQNSEVTVRGGPMGPAGSVISKLFHVAQRVSFISFQWFSHSLIQGSIVFCFIFIIVSIFCTNIRHIICVTSIVSGIHIRLYIISTS